MKRVLKDQLRRFFGRGRLKKGLQKEYPLVLEKSDGCTILCSDYRVSLASELFVKDIGLNNPIELKVPGGVHDFAMFGKSATELVGFCIDLLPPEHKRVVVIAHEDCKRCSHHGNSVEASLRDAEVKFRRKFPHVKLEMYMAVMRVRQKTVFFRRFDQELTTEK